MRDVKADSVPEEELGEAKEVSTKKG